MEKRTKRFVMAFFVILILAVAFFNISDYIITSKLKNYLKNDLSKSVVINYSQLSVSSWQGRLTVVKPIIIKKGNTSKVKYLEMSIDTLLVDGVSYWDYLIHNKISIKKISINNSKIILENNQLIENKNYNALKGAIMDKEVEIDALEITQSDISVFNVQTDSLQLNAENINLNVQNISLSNRTLQKKIPFDFKTYQLAFNSLFYKLNDFDNLTIKTSKIDENSMVFADFKVFTKYTKEKLSSLLITERDHFDVSIDSVVFNKQDFGFKKDTIFFFNVPKTILYHAEAHIYRNKLVGDSPTTKPLYGEMLKNIDFDLMLNEVIVKNSNINYYERAKADNSGGEISFSEFEATLQNVGNTYQSPDKTTIKINTNFMKSSPLKVDWRFDADDSSGSFLFSANLGTFQTNSINKFSAPNLHLRFEGEILKTYFTISGNACKSRVDLKTKYKEFDIIALRNDGKRKNKLISNILNIFVSKNSNQASDDFRLGTEEAVERDKTKSVFNFIWLNVKAGLLDAMTGKPKND